jgi:hypothetical protein
MTGGWSAQYLRMRRWYNRTVAATMHDDRHDLVYAFFESAFHLRDWMVDTGGATNDEMNGFFDAHEEMRLCRDLANAHKHYSLGKKPSQGVPPSEVMEYRKGAGNLGGDHSLMVLSQGKKHDAFELASRILNRWDSFLEERLGLDPRDGLKLGQRPNAATEPDTP